MIDDNSEEIPDFYKDFSEDPMDKIMRESEEVVKQLLQEYDDIHRESSFWTGYVTGNYLATDENEEDAPSVDQMILGEAVKTNFLLMKLIKLLSKKDGG